MANSISILRTLVLNILLLFIPLVISPSGVYSAPAGKSGTGSKQPAITNSMKESVRLSDKGVAQIQSRDFVGAEATLKKALSVDAGNLSAAFNLATVYIVNKKEKSAIELLNVYIEKAPDDAGLFVRLGDAYFGTRNIPTATDAYERAFKLAPDYEELAAKLSTVYVLQNKMDDAEKMLVLAVEQKPRDHKLLTNLCSLYLGNGKPDKAVSVAKKALQIKATKELYISLATAYELQNDYKNSLIAYKRAVDLGDDRKGVKKKIEGLEDALS